MPTRVNLSHTFVILCWITWSCGDGAPAPEALGTVQQQISVAEFMTLVGSDPSLADALALGREAFGSDLVIGAGKLADTDGVTLAYGILRAESAGLVEVVRRCVGDACTSALQEPMTGNDQDVTWRARSGPVPVEGLAMPFQLRDISDDARPDETAVIAAVAGALESEKGDDASPAKSKVRILSAFNRQMTQATTDLDAVVTRVRSGVPDTSVTHKATQQNLDDALSTLGPNDMLVIIAHGDNSTSAGRVTGISVNANYWGAAHYSEARILERIAANPSGGPGFILLGACKSADLLPAIDSRNRVAMGFTDRATPAEIAKVMERVLEALAAGKDARSAIAAGNDVLPGTLQLEANNGADLARTLATAPGADGSCSKDDLSGVWRGNVGNGNPAVTLDFGLTEWGTDASDTCPGCYVSTVLSSVSLVYATVPMKGCARGGALELTRFGESVWTSVELTVVTHDQLRAKLFSELDQDRDGKSDVFEGTMTRQ